MSQQNNFITEDTTITGELTTASSLTIAGEINGSITAGGEVQVLPDALIKGDVSGSAVFVGGRVEGSVSTSGKLIIGGTGQVIGDVNVRALFIEDGGTLDGRCSMTPKRKPAPQGPHIYVPPPGVVDPKYVPPHEAAPTATTSETSADARAQHAQASDEGQ